MTAAELAAYGVELPPNEEELPYPDGMPVESERLSSRGTAGHRPEPEHKRGSRAHERPRSPRAKRRGWGGGMLKEPR